MEQLINRVRNLLSYVDEREGGLKEKDVVDTILAKGDCNIHDVFFALHAAKILIADEV